MEVLGIGLLILGFVLVGIEMCLPGFGLPGISGGISLILGIILTADSIEEGITITILVVVILAVMLTAALLAFRHIKTPFVLEESVGKMQAFINTADLEYLVGKEGTAITDLKPVGKCRIEGVDFDVRAESFYIECGTRVKINRIHEKTIMVQSMK